MSFLPVLSVVFYYIRIKEINRLKGYYYTGLFINHNFKNEYGYSITVQPLPNILNTLANRDFTFYHSGIILPFILLVGMMPELTVVKKLIIFAPMVVYGYTNAVIFEKYCNYVSTYKPTPTGPSGSRFIKFENIGLITWLDGIKTTASIKLCRDIWLSLAITLFLSLSI